MTISIGVLSTTGFQNFGKSFRSFWYFLIILIQKNLPLSKHWSNSLLISLQLFKLWSLTWFKIFSDKWGNLLHKSSILLKQKSVEFSFNFPLKIQKFSNFVLFCFTKACFCKMSETELLTETENFCLNWVVFLTEELSIVVSQLRPLELFEFEFSREVDVASLYAFHGFETKKLSSYNWFSVIRFKVSWLTFLIIIIKIKIKKYICTVSILCQINQFLNQDTDEGYRWTWNRNTNQLCFHSKQ